MNRDEMLDRLRDLRREGTSTAFAVRVEFVALSWVEAERLRSEIASLLPQRFSVSEVAPIMAPGSIHGFSDSTNDLSEEDRP